MVNGSCAPVGAQAFLLPANGETERGVKTIDRARSKVKDKKKEQDYSCSFFIS